MNAKFHPGRVVATPGAVVALAAGGQDADFFLSRHLSGDWGGVGEEDQQSNDRALLDGGRLLSSYHTLREAEVWVVTEAADDAGRRASTTLLLPDEY